MHGAEKNLIKNILKIQGRNCQGEADKIVSYKQCLGFGRAEGKEGRKEKGRGRGKKERLTGYSVLRRFYM